MTYEQKKKFLHQLLWTGYNRGCIDKKEIAMVMNMFNCVELNIPLSEHLHISNAQKFVETEDQVLRLVDIFEKVTMKEPERIAA